MKKESKTTMRENTPAKAKYVPRTETEVQRIMQEIVKPGLLSPPLIYVMEQMMRAGIGAKSLKQRCRAETAKVQELVRIDADGRVHIKGFSEKRRNRGRLAFSNPTTRFVSR